MEKDKRRHLTLLASFGSICFSRVRCDGNSVAYNFDRASQQMLPKKKKSYLIALKTYFIILSHYFIISYLSDILSFNSIH